MSIVTKEELAEILVEIAQAMREGSPESIDHLAWGLQKRADEVVHPNEPDPLISADMIKWGSKWSNNKSGVIYTIVGLSNLKSTREDFPPTVIYKCNNGDVWSRTLTSFMLKFKPV